MHTSMTFSADMHMRICSHDSSRQVGDGKNLVQHFGHRLRYELIEQWKTGPLQGSQQGLASPQVRWPSLST